MKILSLSDKIVPFIYSPQVRQRFQGTDLIIGCGDLAYYYLEYVYNAMDVPLFFVRGNHDKTVEYSTESQRTAPRGCADLHCQVYEYKGFLFAGVEGSLRYRPGQYQYTQSEMWGHVLHLVPRLLMNRLRFGRFLDVFVTHAPAEGIHDMQDLPHQGIKAFRWLITTFQPTYYFHGHVHIYRPDTTFQTQIGRTRVINTFGFRETSLEAEPGSRV
jgi:uncharacterized protein